MVNKTARAKEDIITMFGIDRKPKTAIEIYEFISVHKLSRIRRTLRLLELAGTITSEMVGHSKAYKLA
jgi:hypothetical protein